nr:50S ribosomal protein L19 [Halimeda borneensis]
MVCYLEHFDKNTYKLKKDIFVGDSLKVGFVFKEGRIQFFTGIVTKVSGHKITLYSPSAKLNSGIERIFSYQNPQIQSFIMENPIEGAVPKRRSKSRKILWRGLLSKKTLRLRSRQRRGKKIFKKTRHARSCRGAEGPGCCYGEIGKHTSLRGLVFSVQVRVATLPI